MMWNFILGFIAGVAVIVSVGLALVVFLGRQVVDTTTSRMAGFHRSQDAPFFDPNNIYEGHDYHQG